MKKKFLLLLFSVVTTVSVFSQGNTIILETHQSGASKNLTKEDRHPISLPISVFYDSDTNIIEVWCDNDNIQAEVFVYDENGGVEAYSPYMNVAIQLSTTGNHSILLRGDGWEAEGEF